MEMTDFAILIYLVIGFFGLNRGVWSEFRYDVSPYLGHYVSVIIYFIVWPFYVIYNMLFSEEYSVIEVFWIMVSWAPYTGSKESETIDKIASEMNNYADGQSKSEFKS